MMGGGDAAITKCFLVSLFATSFFSGYQSIQITTLTPTPANPISENPRKPAEIRALLDEDWQTCYWFLNDITMCTMSRPSSGAGMVECDQTDAPLSSLSGGSFENLACKLKIDPFLRDSSGNWTVEAISRRTPVTTVRGTLQVYSTLPPTMTFDPPKEKYEVASNTNLTVTCRGRYGRPNPTSFKWTMDGATIPNATFGPFTVESGPSDDEFGSRPVYQRLTWAAGTESNQRYLLRCSAVQSAGGYTEYELAVDADLTIVKSVSKGLADGWIAFIVIVSLLLLLILLVLIFLWCSGRLICSCCEKRDKEKEKRMEAERRRLQLELNRRAREEARSKPSMGYIVGQDYRDSEEEMVTAKQPTELQLSPHSFSPIDKAAASPFPGSYTSSSSSSSYQPRSHKKKKKTEKPPAIPARNTFTSSAFEPTGANYSSNRRPPPPPPPKYDDGDHSTKSAMSKSPVSGNQFVNQTATLPAYSKKQYDDDGMGHMV